MVLENEDIKVEYELDEKGNIITSTVVKKNSAENKNALKRLDKYSYEDKVLGIALKYYVVTDTVFRLKVIGSNVPNLKELRPLVWLVEDYVESVVIVGGEDLYVHVEEHFLDNGVIDKELLDLFSEELLENIKEFKKDRIEFILGTLGLFRNSTPSELRQLIYYMKDIVY